MIRDYKQVMQDMQLFHEKLKSHTQSIFPKNTIVRHVGIGSEFNFLITKMGLTYHLPFMEVAVKIGEVPISRHDAHHKYDKVHFELANDANECYRLITALYNDPSLPFIRRENTQITKQYS